jgi:glycosyltransferase involved in cell wall biosynthesis
VTRKVLMACANYWNSPIQVGDQQLARKFAVAGWDVAYLSAPLTPLHWLARPADLAARCANYRAGGQRDLGGRVFHYVPGALLAYRDTPLLRSEWMLRNWPRLTFPNASSVLKKNGFSSVDLLYLRDARAYYWLDRLPHRASIYRIADRDAGFRGHGEALAAMQREIAQKADLVLYTAPNLREYAAAAQPSRLHYLPNGVDFEHFSAAVAGTPADIAGIPRPMAIYVGSIDFWFDFELVNSIAAALPKVAFVIIGPWRNSRDKLAARQNVHVLGPREYSDIPAYLKAAQVGIIPFNVREHATLVDAINPIKLYEYFAAGLPCVATEWQALRALNTPAVLARDCAAFVHAIRSLLESPPPREALLDFARHNDWNARFAELMRLITPVLQR